MKKNRFISDPDIPWMELRVTEESHEEYKDHFHPEFFVGAVVQGTTVVEMNGRQYHAPQGSLVVIGPEVVHRCHPQTGTRSYVVVFIDADWSLSLQKELLGTHDRLLIPDDPVLSAPHLFDQLLGLIELLDSSGFALDKSERLVRFVGDLLQKSSRLPLGNIPEPPHTITNIKKRLANCLDENLTLQQLADSVGYNPYYLLRSFKKKTGLTPHEYRLNLRIDRAKELLRQGLLPAAVAAETGFVDQSHFHRTFRQFVAATPGQYRLRK